MMKGFSFLKGVGYTTLFVFSVVLVIIGQANRGMVWLGVMLLGLAGLLVLLYLYNRRYTRADRLAAKKQQESQRGGKVGHK